MDKIDYDISSGDTRFIKFSEVGESKAPIADFFIRRIPNNIQKDAVIVDSSPLQYVGKVIEENWIIYPNQNKNYRHTDEHGKPEFTP